MSKQIGTPATQKKLEDFDLNNLDQFEAMQYEFFIKQSTKTQVLQILINTVEGDYSQLSEKLAEIAEEQDTEIFK